MTDYIACGKVVPERIAAIVKGIAEGCVQAGLRAGRRRDRRAPGPARARRVRRRRRGDRASSRPTSCSARTACSAGDVAHRDGVLAACTPTATRWSATCCSTGAGWQPRPARRGARPHARARSCSSRPGSTRTTAWRSPAAVEVHAFATSPAAGWRRTWPASCRRLLRRPSTARPGRRSRSSTWSRDSAGPRPSSSARSTWASAWSPWSPPRRGRRGASALLADRGVPAWELGAVTTGDGTVAVDGTHPA